MDFINTLSSDILSCICIFLNIRDMVRFSEICRYLNHESCMRIWKTLAIRDTITAQDRVDNIVREESINNIIGNNIYTTGYDMYEYVQTTVDDIKQKLLLEPRLFYSKHVSEMSEEHINDNLRLFDNCVYRGNIEHTRFRSGYSMSKIDFYKGITFICRFLVRENNMYLLMRYHEWLSQRLIDKKSDIIMRVISEVLMNYPNKLREFVECLGYRQDYMRQIARDSIDCITRDY